MENFTEGLYEIPYNFGIWSAFFFCKVILQTAEKSSHPKNQMKEDYKGQSTIFSHHIGTACVKLQIAILNFLRKLLQEQRPEKKPRTPNQQHNPSNLFISIYEIVAI